MKHVLYLLAVLMPAWLRADDWQSLIVHPVKNEATHQLLCLTAKHDDPVMRAEALRALANIRDPQDAALIRSMLADREPAIRQHALRVLGQLHASMSAEEADAFLRDADAALRAEFYAALPHLELPGKLARLEAGLGDAVTAVRLEAARATRDQALLQSRWSAENDPGVLQAMVASGDFLKEAFNSRRPEVVAEALRQVKPADGPAMVETINSLLHHRYPLVQEQAVEAAVRAGLRECVPGIAELARDGDSALRTRACVALGVLGDDASVTALTRQLQEDADAFARHAAAAALVKLHFDDAREAILDSLGRTQPAVRREAVWAVGEWGDASLAGKVMGLLDDDDAGVAMMAARTLGRLKNPDGRAPLRARLARGPVLVQAEVAAALGELKDAGAVAGLIGLLSVGDAGAEANAAQALGLIGDMAAAPALRKILFDMTKHEAVVRERAVTALQAMRDREPVNRVMQLLTEMIVPTPAGPGYDSAEVRIAALRYLAALGDPALGKKILSRMPAGAPAVLRPVLAETLTVLTGRRYVPVPDHSYISYLVESNIGWTPPEKTPAIGVREE